MVSAEYNYGAKEETRSLYKEGRVSTLPVIALYAIVYVTWPLYSYFVMLKKGAPETPVLRTGYRNVTPPAPFINDEMSLKERIFGNGDRIRLEEVFIEVKLHLEN